MVRCIARMRDSVARYLSRVALWTLRVGLHAALATPPLWQLGEALLVRLRHRFAGSRLLTALAQQWLFAIERWRPTETARIAMLPGGLRLAITLADDWHRGLYFRGVYEPETTVIVNALLRPGDVFLDVGANIGYYACLAAGRGALVHAFEPNAHMMEHVRRSIALNHFAGRLIANEVAVAAEDGGALLHLSPQAHNTGLSSLLPLGHLAAGEAVRVPTVCLDTYCRQHGIERIRLLKIDVEGAEFQVLAGATGVLATIRPEAIICELGGFAEGCRPTTVLGLLGEAGYRPYEMAPTGLVPFSPGAGTDLDSCEWEQRNLCFLLPSVVV